MYTYIYIIIIIIIIIIYKRKPPPHEGVALSGVVLLIKLWEIDYKLNQLIKCCIT